MNLKNLKTCMFMVFVVLFGGNVCLFAEGAIKNDSQRVKKEIKTEIKQGLMRVVATRLQAFENEASFEIIFCIKVRVIW